MSIPILYSLQHCPYAMRARMALLMARQDVMVRSIVTKDKPKEMLDISPKGTVPILVMPNGELIDESLDIMTWSLSKSDPHDLLYQEDSSIYQEMLNLIQVFDHDFRMVLLKYKSAKRYHENNELDYRVQCEIFIQMLEVRLAGSTFIMGDKLSLVDLAILPFIRQFANTDKKWFRETKYKRLREWLTSQMNSLLFTKAMRKFPLWLESKEEFLLSWDKL